MKRCLRLFSTVTGVMLVLMLSGCFLPENFKALVKVGKNGNFSFTYNGNLAYAPALSAIKNGSFGAKDEKTLKEQVKELKKEPDFKDVQYIGKGRYKVAVEHAGKAGENYYFISDQLKIFSIENQKDGTLKIAAFELSKKDIDGLKTIDAKVVGKLMVSVEKGIQVIEHNAQTEPKTFSPYGDYQWDIKNPETAPYIILKF
jgi:hypothetical protein